MSTSTIKVKSGECVILPSNAKIITATTFATNPSVTSADCPDLALAIEDAIQPGVSAQLRVRDANEYAGARKWTPNVENYNIFRARFFNGTSWVEYPTPNTEVDADETAWKNLMKMTGTPLEGAIRVTGYDRREGKRGSTVIISVLTTQYIIDNLMFDGVTSSVEADGDQVNLDQIYTCRFLNY